MMQKTSPFRQLNFGFSIEFLTGKLASGGAFPKVHV
jgi:hypothetical protein